MVQLKETEKRVRPSETPPCGQHGKKTKAQRMDSGESSSSDSKKKFARSDDDYSHSRNSLISQSSSGSSCESHQNKWSIVRVFNFKMKISLESRDFSGSTCLSNRDIEYKKNQEKERLQKLISQLGQKDYWSESFNRPDFSESSRSDSKKDIETADGDSVQSSVSRWPDFHSYPLKKDVASDDGGSVSSFLSRGLKRYSSDKSLITLESQDSSESSKSKNSPHRDIDFKEKGEEKTSPLITQELVDVSSAETEIKSTDPPVAVPTGPPKLSSLQVLQLLLSWKRETKLKRNEWNEKQRGIIS